MDIWLLFSSGKGLPDGKIYESASSSACNVAYNRINGDQHVIVIHSNNENHTLRVSLVLLRPLATISPPRMNTQPIGISCAFKASSAFPFRQASRCRAVSFRPGKRTICIAASMKDRSLGSCLSTGTKTGGMGIMSK